MNKGIVLTINGEATKLVLIKSTMIDNRIKVSMYKGTMLGTGKTIYVVYRTTVIYQEDECHSAYSIEYDKSKALDSFSKMVNDIRLDIDKRKLERLAMHLHPIRDDILDYIRERGISIESMTIEEQQAYLDSLPVLPSWARRSL